MKVIKVQILILLSVVFCQNSFDFEAYENAPENTSIYPKCCEKMIQLTKPWVNISGKSII